MREEEKTLGDLVPQVLSQVLGRRRHEDIEKIRLIYAAWRDLVGEEAARRTRPLMLKEGRLTIGAASPSWCMEMAMRIEEIKRSVREKLGDEIKEVMVKTIK